MNRFGMIAMMVAVMGLGMVGCWDDDEETTTTPPVEAASCTCDTAKVDDGWCSDCNKGYIGGEGVKCKSCFGARTGDSGWCEGCNKGYVAGNGVTCKGCSMTSMPLGVGGPTSGSSTKK